MVPVDYYYYHRMRASVTRQNDERTMKLLLLFTEIAKTFCAFYSGRRLRRISIVRTATMRDRLPRRIHKGFFFFSLIIFQSKFAFIAPIKIHGSTIRMN